MKTDLIDRKALEFEIISGITIAENTFQYAQAVIDRIRSAPVVDAEPVIYAHWEQKEESDECSYCGYEVSLDFPITKRCPNCGAKMIGEAKE